MHGSRTFRAGWAGRDFEAARGAPAYGYVSAAQGTRGTVFLPEERSGRRPLQALHATRNEWAGGTAGRSPSLEQGPFSQRGARSSEYRRSLRLFRKARRRPGRGYGARIGRGGEEGASRRSALRGLLLDGVAAEQQGFVLLKGDTGWAARVSSRDGNGGFGGQSRVRRGTGQEHDSCGERFRRWPVPCLLGCLWNRLRKVRDLLARPEREGSGDFRGERDQVGVFPATWRRQAVHSHELECAAVAGLLCQAGVAAARALDGGDPRGQDAH